MAAVYNRKPERALGVYRYAGLRRRRPGAGPQAALDEAIRRQVPAVAEDPFTICRSPEIDVIVDVTGSVEFGAQVILEAFRHGKSVVLMNAEVDATLGPILRVYGEEARSDPVCVRRRRAGRADEPLPLGQGSGPHAAGHGQRQGPSGSLSQPDHPAGLGRAVGPERGHGDVLRRRLEDQLRAVHRGQRHGLQGEVARHVARPQVRRLDHGHPEALRHRRAARGGRHRRLHGGAAAHQGVLPGRAPGPQAAPLPEPLQDGRGPALPVLDSVPPGPLRGAQRHRPGRALRGRGGAAARRAGGRGMRRGQARPQGRRGARRVRDVHDLRRGRERGRDERAALPAGRAGRGLPAPARRREGPGADLRGRRPARRDGWPTVCGPSSTGTSAARPGSRSISRATAGRRAPWQARSRRWECAAEPKRTL